MAQAYQQIEAPFGALAMVSVRVSTTAPAQHFEQLRDLTMLKGEIAVQAAGNTNVRRTGNDV